MPPAALAGARVRESSGDRACSPVVLCLPWGLVIGPFALLPHLPLPAQITVQVGEPLGFPGGGQRLPRGRAVEQVHRATVTRLEERVGALHAERRHPVLG